jgi:tetratricopeptide (TPR) repeat protein
MLGRLHQIANNSVEAEKAFKKSLELEPENEDALTGLALVLSNLGDHKKSTELLEKVASKSPGMRTLLALAQGYEQMRDFKLASETLKKAVTMSPGNSEVRRALAQTLIYAEQYDEALKEYQELVEDDPRDAASWLRISQIHRQRRAMTEAREAADKAKSLDANNLEVRYNDANLLEAEGKVAEGIAVIKEMLAATTKRNYSPMEKQYRAQLLDRLGQMSRSLEQPADAVKAFREMAEMDPENAARASAQIVETWRLARDYPKAMEEADAAIKKYPQDRMVKLIRANLLADTGKTNEAAAEIKGLLDGKNDRETWMSLAQIYEKGKNFGEMAKAVDAAEKLSTTGDEKEGVWFMRGAMFERQKKHDQAEAEFRKILKANPANAGALNYLGYMLADRNVRLNEALDLIQKALAQDPGNGAYLDSLGWVYFRLDRLQDAEKQLQAAIEKVPTDPTVRDHLGDVYAKQGRLKEAVDQWQSSLTQWKQSAPAEADSNEIAKVQKKLDNAKVRLAKEGTPAKKP